MAGAKIWVKEYENDIGNISVVKIEEHISAADIGYCMGKNWWGRGIMSEALKAVIKYLFEEIDINRIAASHDTMNPKSGRVIDKAGMKVEGTLRDASTNTQGICDVTFHSILKREYETDQR